MANNFSFQEFFQSFFEVHDNKTLYEHHISITSSPEKRSQLLTESDKMVKEFYLKYTIPETIKFVQQHLDVTGEFAMPSEPSSSFQLVCSFIDQMRAKNGRSLEKDLPQRSKQLISIGATDENSPNTNGSNLAALEINVGEHGKQREELNTTTADSSTFPNISSAAAASLNNLKHTSSPDHSIDIPNSQINEPINTEINNNIPSSPTASNEPTKLDLATFAAIVELVSTLSNFEDNNSSRVKEHQILMYIMLISSTVAFLLSLTALLLLDKMPVAAKKMQKVACFFGAFGYMGIVGMLMPQTIMLWFTISAFVVCLLIFTITTFM